MRKDFLWVEKYRPKTIDDCILPKDIKKTFKEVAKQGVIPNLLLSGSPGTGKTTVARALCDEVDAEYIFINGSKDGNIDTLRTKINDFASSVSLQGARKVVILDEADYLNPNSTQPALRGFIEEFSKNCTFIFTCNFKNRILAPVRSRLVVVDFKIPDKEKPVLAKQFLDRLSGILEGEEIKYEKKVIAALITKFFPDFRRTLGELQNYGRSGQIDVGILSSLSEVSIKELMAAMKAKDFKSVRKWVVQNLDNDPVRVFRKIYDSSKEYFKPGSIPELILIIADYQYKAAFVPDQEINMVAALVQIMLECEME